MEKKNLRISIIQSDLFWENKKKNFASFKEKIKKIEETDLIILPEMFSTAFSMNSKDLAEEMTGESMNFLKEKASEKNSAIITSFIAKDKNNYFNRLVFVRPDGNYDFYDKRHLFRMSDENLYYKGGQEKIIINWNGWRISPLVCYDLRFPVWSRNKNNYDLLIYIANFPESRNHVWKTLLKARAIENQVFTVGVNRVGTDGFGAKFSGDSAVINPKGYDISNIKPFVEETKTIDISLNELNEFRDKFPVHLDADKFKIYL